MTGAAATIEVVELDVHGYRRAIPELATLIVEAVAHGASINFTAEVTTELAGTWWENRIDSIVSGQTTAFAATAEGRIVGSTLLVRSLNQNSPHRAEIGKVIVHPGVRRRGIARALMQAAEDRARADGRWLLVLDTVTGSPADALYRSLGWHETGIVPDYALLPDGQPWPATFFWKSLR